MSGRVVVGVDGSETAKRAVRWAAREATLRGTTLELVSAWEIPIYSYAYGYGFTPISDEMLKGLATIAEDQLAAALQVARAEARDIEMESIAIEGQAAKVLLEASKGAELLVVGSRGLGGFRELLLGSVSQQCAQHCTCPVVIVRHLDADEAAA
jgi:nucleotide-binding universal stress UspA family protein